MNCLSNFEVLTMLNKRSENQHSSISKSIRDYLIKINTNENKYKMSTLRKIKDIDTESLCLIANLQNHIIVNESRNLCINNFDKKYLDVNKC